MGEVTQSRELLPELGVLPGHLMWRSAAKVTAALGDNLPPGVDIHAYAALLALAETSTRSQQAVAEMISVSRTTMARVALDLAGSGLVRRERNPADRRSYTLARTAEGGGAAVRWRRHAEQVEVALTPSFSEAERRELRALLLRSAEEDLSPGTPDPLRESIAFLVVRVYTRIHREAVEALAHLSIEPRFLGLLVALEAHGPTSQAGAARCLGISGASLVQIADDMEARGLLERRALPGDRRAHVLHPTGEAVRVLREARGYLERPAGALDALDAAELDRLLELLRQLITGGTAPEG